MTVRLGSIAQDILLQQRLAHPASLAEIAFDRYTALLAAQPRLGAQLDLYRDTDSRRELELWRSIWCACELEALHAR